MYLNLNNLRSEQEDEIPVEKKGWQDALQAVYPFKINRFRIAGGDLVYQDESGFKPLHLGGVNFEARNIQNVDYGDREYPSEMRLEAAVFEKGALNMGGQANFLLEPHPGLKAISNQGLMWLSGSVEFAPDKTSMVLDKVRLKGLELDYVHLAETARAEMKMAVKAKEAAEKPETLLKIKHLRIEDDSIGFINRAANPDYRVFFDGVNMTPGELQQPLQRGARRVGLNSRRPVPGRR